MKSHSSQSPPISVNESVIEQKSLKLFQSLCDHLPVEILPATHCFSLLKAHKEAIDALIKPLSLPHQITFAKNSLTLLSKLTQKIFALQTTSPPDFQTEWIDPILSFTSDLAQPLSDRESLIACRDYPPPIFEALVSTLSANEDDIKQAALYFAQNKELTRCSFLLGASKDLISKPSQHEDSTSYLFSLVFSCLEIKRITNCLQLAKRPTTSGSAHLSGSTIFHSTITQQHRTLLTAFTKQYQPLADILLASDPQSYPPEERESLSNLALLALMILPVDQINSYLSKLKEISKQTQEPIELSPKYSSMIIAMSPSNALIDRTCALLALDPKNLMGLSGLILERASSFGSKNTARLFSALYTALQTSTHLTNQDFLVPLHQNMDAHSELSFAELLHKSMMDLKMAPDHPDMSLFLDLFRLSLRRGFDPHQKTASHEKSLMDRITSSRSQHAKAWFSMWESLLIEKDLPVLANSSLTSNEKPSRKMAL